MTDKIEVYLRGGLGNQLFQYAAGVSLSTKLQVPLLLKTNFLPEARGNSGVATTWPEQISSFDHLGTLADMVPRSELGSWIQTRFGQTTRMVGDVFPRIPQALGFFANENNPDFAGFDRISKPLKINAYCADPAYFESVADTVAGSIKNLRRPSDWYLQMQAQLLLDQPIGVHLRLGDYENLAHIYGTTRTSYIARAIALLKERSPDSPVWIFSDDPDRAKEILKGLVAFDFIVESPNTIRPLENLLLLSQCRSLIGTNSTFSWWAAFLGNQSDGQTVFPRPLYPNPKLSEPKRWLMPAWMQVGDD